MSTLIGHEKLLGFLRTSLERDRLAHAYLFAGPEHVGKMTLARAFAAVLLGEDKPLDTQPDLFIVERGRDAKTGKLHNAIVLDQVQALCGRLSMGSFMGGWKVCILDGADLLNKEAANALLKNLEEPHPKTLLILLADAADGIAPTLRSRCQIMTVNRVPEARIAEALIGSGQPADRARLLAKLSDGCPGKALGYARDEEAFRRMMDLREAVLRIFESRIAERWTLLEKLVPPKGAFQETIERGREVLGIAGELLRDAMLSAHGRPDAVTHGDLVARTAAIGQRLGPSRAASAADAVVEARRLLGENVSPRAVLDVFALSF